MPMGEANPTTLDRFLGGRLVIRQPKSGYRAGIDPVFLAAALEARAGEHVLDMGCGVGTAALCLTARLAGVTVTGLELQPELAELARANAEANGLADRVRVVDGCLTARPVPESSVDWVMTNPPWYEASKVSAPQTRSKAMGHVEGEADLPAWVRSAQRALKPKGRLVMIHRADRLGDILSEMTACRMGGIRVFPLFAKPGAPAIRVIVTAAKGSRTPLELLPGMVLHDEAGYVSQAEAVLRDGAALAMG